MLCAKPVSRQRIDSRSSEHLERFLTLLIGRVDLKADLANMLDTVDSLTNSRLKGLTEWIGNCRMLESAVEEWL